MVLATRSAGSNWLTRPCTICVLPQPAPPTSMTWRARRASRSIQKVMEAVSGVGTVTVDMAVVALSKSTARKKEQPVQGPNLREAASR